MNFHCFICCFYSAFWSVSGNVNSTWCKLYGTQTVIFEGYQRSLFMGIDKWENWFVSKWWGTVGINVWEKKLVRKFKGLLLSTRIKGNINFLKFRWALSKTTSSCSPLPSWWHRSGGTLRDHTVLLFLRTGSLSLMVIRSVCCQLPWKDGRWSKDQKRSKMSWHHLLPTYCFSYGVLLHNLWLVMKF